MKTSFIEFFVEEFERRRRRNPRYSMRAFARDLDLSPSRLHHILDGRIGLSREAAEKAADRLDLMESDRALFLAMVESKHGRSKVQKQLAEANLHAITSPDVRLLTETEFSLLKHWYLMAILLLIDTKGFQSSPAWIAAKLGISEETTEEALQSLIAHDFLRRDEDGNLKRSEKNLSFHSPNSNDHLKAYYGELILKGHDSLHEVPMDQRDVSASVFTCHRSDFEYAKNAIAKFRKHLARELSNHDPGDRVYGLTIQFFPLDRDETPGPGLEHESRDP